MADKVISTGSAEALAAQIAACRACAGAFSTTATHHSPRPVVWFQPGARLLIAGQAPGLRVHDSGPALQRCLWRSAARLARGSMRSSFYDRTRVAIVPMAFCFPGYDAKGADLPPPPALRRHLARAGDGSLARAPAAPAGGRRGAGTGIWARRNVTDTVRAGARSGGAGGAMRDFPLPHPSWRNTGWLKRHPWFEAEALPALRAEVARLMQVIGTWRLRQ